MQEELLPLSPEAVPVVGRCSECGRCLSLETRPLVGLDCPRHEFTAWSEGPCFLPDDLCFPEVVAVPRREVARSDMHPKPNVFRVVELG